MRACFMMSIFTLLLVFQSPAMAATMRLELTPAAPLEAGKTVHVVAKLSRISDGTSVTLADLKMVHTKKIHLLVIDPALSDYHHLHPVAEGKAGEYGFDFTPRTNARYRIFADVSPVATGKQEYVQADFGTVATAPAAIDRTETSVAEVDGYRFALALDSPLKAGEATMASIAVTRDGKPVTTLQPVMGAFAHVVAFGEDHQSVLHVHPMGAEPNTESARGGPNLQFHIEPHAAGFIKLFAQVRIDGKDLFAPFGVMVK